MTNQSFEIIRLACGIYCAADLSPVVYINPKEILANIGMPATQELCASAYAMMAITVRGGGFDPILIEVPDAMSNEDYIRSLQK